MRKRQTIIAGLMSVAVLVSATVAVNAYADEVDQRLESSSGVDQSLGGANLPAEEGGAEQPDPPEETPQPGDDGGAGRLGEAAADREANKRDFSIEVDLSDPAFSGDRISQMVGDFEASDMKLSDFVIQGIQRSTERIPGPALERNVDFDGKLERTANGVRISIEGGEVFTNVNWWQTALASTVALILMLAGDAACTAFLPEVVTLCPGIGGAIGELGKNLIIMAIDEKLSDPAEWGNTLVNVIFAFAGGVVWGQTPLGAWTRDKLPGIIGGLGNQVKAFGEKLSTFWGVMRGATLTTGDFMIELGPFVQRAAARIVTGADAGTGEGDKAEEESEAPSANIGGSGEEFGRGSALK